MNGPIDIQNIQKKPAIYKKPMQTVYKKFICYAIYKKNMQAMASCRK